MNRTVQLYGLLALTLLAVGILGLIGMTFGAISQHIGPDGRVPSSEAFGFTALLLAFREVVATIRTIWDTEARNNLTDKLAASAPQAPPAIEPPADVPNG